MPILGIKTLVTNRDDNYAWVLKGPCAICGEPLESLDQVLLGKYFNSDEFTGRDIVLHKECMQDFEFMEDNGFGVYDPDSYLLYQFVHDEVAEKLASRLDFMQIECAVPFSLKTFDSELFGEAVWLTDQNGVTAYGIYDGISVYIETVNQNTNDPLHQRILEFFG